MKLQITTTDGDSYEFPIDTIQSIGIIEMNTLGEDIANAILSAPIEIPPIESPVVNVEEVVEEAPQTIVQEDIENTPTVITSEDFVLPQNVELTFHDAEGKEYVVKENDTVDVIIDDEPLIEVVADPKAEEKAREQAVQSACDDIIGDLMDEPTAEAIPLIADVQPPQQVSQDAPLIARNPQQVTQNAILITRNPQMVVDGGIPQIINRVGQNSVKPRQVVQVNPTMTEI